MTQAPSIKEALEAALLVLREYDFPGAHPHRRAVHDQVKAALATFQPDGERREAIARLATRFWSIHPKEIQDMGLTREQFYVHEMTNLLASGLVQDEAGIRADEREKCAKLAESCHGVDEGDLPSDVRAGNRTAVAIRSARDGGAES